MTRRGLFAMLLGAGVAPCLPARGTIVRQYLYVTRDEPRASRDPRNQSEPKTAESTRRPERAAIRESTIYRERATTFERTIQAERFT